MIIELRHYEIQYTLLNRTVLSNHANPTRSNFVRVVELLVITSSYSVALELGTLKIKKLTITL
jgi:hypothetical protein